MSDSDQPPDAALPAPRATLRQCDVLHALLGEEDESFSGFFADVPYGLGDEPTPEQITAYLAGADLITNDFMGHNWQIPSLKVWREIYRVLKPGAHLAVYGGVRTFDLISLGLRMAGFSNRDTVAAEGVLRWYRGQGYPQGQNISKALDKEAGVTRADAGPGQYAARKPHGTWTGACYGDEPAHGQGPRATLPATDLAAAFDDFHTQLKGLWEPVLLFRKPLGAHTHASCAATHGTGALNVGECRLGLNGEKPPTGSHDQASWRRMEQRADIPQTIKSETPTTGRYPPNVVLCHTDRCELVGSRSVAGSSGREAVRNSPTPSTANAYGKYKRRSVANVGDGTPETIDAWRCPTDGSCPVAVMDALSGVRTSGDLRPLIRSTSNFLGPVGMVAAGQPMTSTHAGDTGTASRFFYQGRTSTGERNTGVEHLRWVPDTSRPSGWRQVDQATYDAADLRARSAGNIGPCVKPQSLGVWISKLIKPPPVPAHGPRRLLQLYSGTGSETLAALAAGWDEVVACERDPDFADILRARLAHALGTSATAAPTTATPRTGATAPPSAAPTPPAAPTPSAAPPPTQRLPQATPDAASGTPTLSPPAPRRHIVLAVLDED